MSRSSRTMSVSAEESPLKHVSNAFSLFYLDVTESGPSNGTGLNLIYSDRAEEVVEHEELVQPALAEQEYPDRIYGQQQITSFEEALYSPSKRYRHADGRSARVSETVRFTPFKQFREPLLSHSSFSKQRVRNLRRFRSRRPFHFGPSRRYKRTYEVNVRDRSLGKADPWFGFYPIGEKTGA